MPLDEKMKYKGHLQGWLNGQLVVDKDNLIVTVGKGLAASRLMRNTDNFINYMAIGAGTVPPAVGDTQLGNELGRVATTNTLAGAVAKWEATFAPGTGTGNITEAGLLNAAAAGSMMSRITFSAIPKLDTDELKFTWTIEAQV